MNMMTNFPRLANNIKDKIGEILWDDV